MTCKEELACLHRDRVSKDSPHNGYARAVAGVAPGKNVVGIVGMGILVVSPKPLARSSGILAAEYPDLRVLLV